VATATTQARAAERLARVLDALGPVAVAVSGGVDSMTLAAFAHRRAPEQTRMFHAVSPAVPAAATVRARARALRDGWALAVIDAGELADPRYRANPRDRCFHCKTSLYRAIGARTSWAVVSGANLDDLSDYRPGLEAAKDHGVRHPYVEAAIDKATVRALAAALGLDDVAELPAAPCLSSRVETGIAIDGDALRMIDAAERFVRRRARPRTVRCRLRGEGVVIELDDAALARLDAGARDAVTGAVAAMFARAGAPQTVRLAPYVQGSAFVRGAEA
jgi:uncharacterized protein